MSSDAAAVLAIAAAAEAADGVAPLDEATLLALEDGSITIHVVEGGFTLVREDELSLVVHPARREHGLGHALLSRVLRTDPGTLSAWSHGNHPGAAALAKRHGFEAVRDLWVMRRPMPGPLPSLVPQPGVTVRTYREGDAAEVVRVNAAAFAAHPEQGAMDERNLRRRMAEPWFDPEGLIVAEADGGLVGFHWTKQHSPRLGEVYVVGIDPTAQGRGLGKALTLAGLHHLKSRGVAETLLYVESDNAAAIAVYERLGFTHEPADTHVMYRRTRAAG